MSNRNVVILIGSIIAIFILMIFVFFEFKHIPDTTWYGNYYFDDESPYGSYVFHELLEDAYGEEKVVKNIYDTLLYEVKDSNNLYVLIGQYDWSKLYNDSLKLFLSRGNQVLFIGDWQAKGQLTGNYEDQEYTYLVLPDENDSLLQFSFEDNNAIKYNYTHYYRDFDKPAKNTYHAIGRAAYDSHITLGRINDTLDFFFQWESDTLDVYQHTLPELFSNLASHQDFYLEHFNKVFSRFDPNMIILDHPNIIDPYDYLRNRESPIQFILNTPALKWAYYCFMLAMILYLVFRGKRKQRAIPVLEKNENTSLEYVDTLSKLFEKQDQNKKLVPHLEQNFYHSILKKYFLSPEKDDFIKVLSRKSKVPEKEIMAIMKNFKSAKDGYDFNDSQLVALHKRIENFYHNAE